MAAVPADHPLTCRKRVTLADIAAHPVICLPEGTGIRAVFDRGCAARGVRSDIALQASAPGSVADLDAPALLALVWRDTDTPMLRELVRNCRTAFA